MDSSLEDSLNSGLGDSLHSGLDYDAEVAYISMTSPLRSRLPSPSAESLDEFDFSTHYQVDSQDDGEKTQPGDMKQTEPSPTLVTIVNNTPDKEPDQEELEEEKNSSLVSPIPHFTLTTGPITPKLHHIRAMQETPPSPKPRLKLEKGQYCTLVVYGTRGCGHNHLVDKLALSNPSIFAKVIPSTTRKRRPSEVSGVDFHYLSSREMSIGIARGDFIEYVHLHRKGKKLQKRDIPQQVFLQPTSCGEGLQHLPASSRGNSNMQMTEKKFDSLSEDSPVIGGEYFGTSYQALTQAIQQSKPCVLLNVSTRGAQQLKSAGLEAFYVLVHNEPLLSQESILEPDYTISASSLDYAYSELHSYAFQVVTELNLPSTSQYEVTKYTWDALPTVEFQHQQSLLNKKYAEVTFSEMLAYFHGTNLKKQTERAKEEPSKLTFSPFSRLSRKLRSEKLLVQAIAYSQISDKEHLHLRTLQTIYSKLTGNSLHCRRIGSHWQEIGFTGVDPADDMQEVGLLGLMQLVYFLGNSHTFHFCKEIFRYCHRDTHVIPFCVLAFSFSKLSLEALESGTLNKLCNKREQVLVVVNEFYMAAFHHYYLNWKASQKSILQLGLLMQQNGDYSKSHPRQVMEEFNKHLSAREPQYKFIPTILPKAENAFTPFEDITTSS